MTKIDQIKQHLISNKPLTSWECIHKYNHTRLASVIHYLRTEEEWNIHTEREVTDDGDSYAVYTLVSQ